MNFTNNDGRLDDYLLPQAEELEEFTIFDEDMPYGRESEDVFYQEWP